MPLKDSSAFPENFPDPKLPAAIEVDEMLTRIKHSHGHYYKVMNLEVWALVETLDQLFPGAWGRFMANRQVALKQFLQRDRDRTDAVETAEDVEEKALRLRSVTGSVTLSDRSKEEEGTSTSLSDRSNTLSDRSNTLSDRPKEEEGTSTSLSDRSNTLSDRSKEEEGTSTSLSDRSNTLSDRPKEEEGTSTSLSDRSNTLSDRSEEA